MTTTYELKHNNGIPYYINNGIVHTFELKDGKPAPTCVAIGTYDTTTDRITYYPDWRVRVKSNLDTFRAGITVQERDKLRETVSKPIKQRKTTRNSRKSTKRTANSSSE